MSYTVCSTEKRKREIEDAIVCDAESSIIYHHEKGHYDSEARKYIIDEVVDEPLFLRISIAFAEGDIEEVSFAISENSYFECLDQDRASEYKVLRNYWNYGSQNSYALEDVGDDTYSDYFIDMAHELLKDFGISVKSVSYSQHVRNMKVNISFWGSGSSDITDRIECNGEVYLIKSRLEADDISSDGFVGAHAEGPFVVQNGNGEEIESYDEIWNAIESPFFKVFVEQKAAALEDMESSVQGEIDEAISSHGEDYDYAEDLGSVSIYYEVDDNNP